MPHPVVKGLLRSRNLLHMKKLPDKASPSRLQRLQDQWLFRLAYPSGKKAYEQAQEALYKLAGADMQEPAQQPTDRFPARTVTGSFSYAIARWLCLRFPDHAEIESSAANAEAVRLFFRRTLPRCEYESITTGNAGLLKRIEWLKGSVPGSKLAWLIRQMENKLSDEIEKEQLFDQLQIFIRCQIKDPKLLPAAARAPVQRLGFHRQIQKKVRLQPIIRRPLPPPISLSLAQKKDLIDLARTSLLFLYRETEPFTYASTDELHLFELENGWSVALFSMQAERRLSLESYIGYLAFKNGIPVAYGGGWLFGKRCQFGINIFPAFRGGTSALLMAQLLRVYHQYYGAARFVVKPYQFGWQNPEAIRTGAFWFYYKAGFRPEDKELLEMARQEMKKKKADPQYRSSQKILKAFTRSSLFLQWEQDAFPIYDASQLSRAITRMIRDRFAGDRQWAIRESVKEMVAVLHIPQWEQWSALEKRALEEWSLLLQCSTETAQWTAAEKKKLVRLIRSRGRVPEEKCIRQMQELKRLWKDWDHFLSQPMDKKQSSRRRPSIQTTVQV